MFEEIQLISKTFKNLKIVQYLNMYKKNKKKNEKTIK